MELDIQCSRCTLGCQLHIESEDGELRSLTGNDCPMGEEYARFLVLMED